jgi:hypothetical protein
MMRPVLSVVFGLALAACQMQAPKAGDGTSALASEAVVVTPLDAAPPAAAPDAAVQVPAKTTPRPEPRPANTATPAPAPVASEPAPPPVSPEQATCEKAGGQWSGSNGSTGHVCVHATRDSGKFCRKKTDCQGQCLAQSHTCAPIQPLMGCNAILQANGSEVTLCLQ